MDIACVALGVRIATVSPLTKNPPIDRYRHIPTPCHLQTIIIIVMFDINGQLGIVWSVQAHHRIFSERPVPMIAHNRRCRLFHSRLRNIDQRCRRHILFQIEHYPPLDQSIFLHLPDNRRIQRHRLRHRPQQHLHFTQQFLLPGRKISLTTSRKPQSWLTLTCPALEILNHRQIAISFLQRHLYHSNYCFDRPY